jgi:hypothetical protein
MLTDVSEKPTSLIALIMEAVSISETSANTYQTKRHKIPEDSCLQAEVVFMMNSGKE